MKRDKVLHDPKIAKAVLFLMYRLKDVDIEDALAAVDGLQILLGGEDLPTSRFPLESLLNLTYVSPDGVTRIYDSANGFVEI